MWIPRNHLLKPGSKNQKVKARKLESELNFISTLFVSFFSSMKPLLVANYTLAEGTDVWANTNHFFFYPYKILQLQGYVLLYY